MTTLSLEGAFALPLKGKVLSDGLPRLQNAPPTTAFSITSRTFYDRKAPP